MSKTPTKEMIERMQASLGHEGVYVGNKTVERALTAALQSAADTPSPPSHLDLREAAWSLVNDLDRSLVGSRDIAVIHATNTSVKRLRILLEKLDRETPSPQPSLGGDVE